MQFTSVFYSSNSTGLTPTPTPTCPLGMRLSCIFKNMYTIVYHIQYMYTCKRAHPQRTSSRGKARVQTKVGSTSWRAERAASAAELPAAECVGHANFLARILVWKSARKSVSVSVSLLWNFAISAHNTEIPARCTSQDQRVALG